MKSHYEKMSVTPLGVEPFEGLMASSILIQKEQVTVDAWSSVRFDGPDGEQDFVDLTFE